MRARAAVVAARLWEHPHGAWGALRRLLTPAAAVYGGTIAARNLAYRAGLLRTRRASARTVSIGNLRVGGTGKTPLTRWLADEIRLRGVAVAIVSRGYGGGAREPHVVGDGAAVTSDVERSGDEAVMLARTAGVPVVAGRDRVAAAALAVERFGSELVLCDDAFQHRRLERDLDVVLVDAEERGGIGRLLPAGPLREPLGALRRADVVVLRERGDAAPEEHGGAATAEEATFAELRRDGGARERRGDRLVVRARFVPAALVEARETGWHTMPLGALARERIVAVSGVARPAALYAAIRDWEGEIVQVLEYPDHHVYDTRAWKHIAQLAKDADLVVTTEKDLVKLERFPFARGKLVALRLGVVVEPAAALVGRVIGDARAEER